MWIDPLEVSYRIGENGSICVLYEFKEGSSNEPWKPKYYNSNKTLDNKNKSLITATHNNQKNLDDSASMVAACKDSIRKMDFLLDPRKSVSNIEQLAAYVSS
jgi:aryl carrier-like protein